MIASLAREGGLQSTLWAGPESISRAPPWPTRFPDRVWRNRQCGIVRSRDAAARPAPAAQGAELSDGTLRYLLWIAALLTPRPPALLVLNEPETSLHPDLLPALGRLIAQAATRSQVIAVSHAPPLIDALQALPECHSIMVEKTWDLELGI